MTLKECTECTENLTRLVDEARANLSGLCGSRSGGKCTLKTGMSGGTSCEPGEKKT